MFATWFTFLSIIFVVAVPAILIIAVNIIVSAVVVVIAVVVVVVVVASAIALMIIITIIRTPVVGRTCLPVSSLLIIGAVIAVTSIKGLLPLNIPPTTLCCALTSVIRSKISIS